MIWKKVSLVLAMAIEGGGNYSGVSIMRRESFSHDAYFREQPPFFPFP